MPILDPNEFKRAFEKAERYATAALEVKKLREAKDGIKKAKDAKGILQVDRNVKQQLIRTRDVLKAWEKTLSPPFKQLVSSRRVFKELEDDIKLNAKNIERSAADANKPVDKVKKVNLGAEVRGRQGKLDAAARSIKQIEDYLKAYAKLEPSIKDGTIAPQELVKLQSTGKPLIALKQTIAKNLEAIEKEFEKLQEAGSSGSLDGSVLKDAIAKLEGYQKKVQSFDKLDELLSDVKDVHKKLFDDKAGWLALVKGANETAAGLTKSIAEITKILDAIMAKNKDWNTQWPDSKSANLKADEAAKRLSGLRDWGRQLKEAPVVLKKKADAFEAAHKSFASRVDKLIKSDTYDDQAPNDKAIATAGLELSKTAKSMAATRDSLTKRLTEFAKLVTATANDVSKRVLDYENVVAAAKLSKK